MSTLLTPTEAATRREFLTALGAAGLLAGCGAAPTDPTDADVPGFPRTVAHSGGETTLDAPPERVFLGTTRAALEDLLSIGIIPTAIAQGGTETLPSWARQRGAADILCLDSGALDLETLAAQDIDLSLLPAFLADGPEAPRLQALSPTVRLANFVTTPVTLDLYGRVFAREAEAAEVVRRLAEQIASWTPPRRPGSITVFFAAPAAGVFVYLPGDGAMATLLADVGLPLPDRGMPAGEFGFDLATENLDQLDADLVLAVAPYPGDAAALDAIEVAPLFAAVPAVADGRYVRLDTGESQALLGASSLGVPFALDALTRALTL